MGIILFYKKETVILKGIYHAHSTYSSDGKIPLAELKKLLMESGFRFVVMTEHAEDMTPDSLKRYYDECLALSDDQFVCIPGLEIPYKGKIHVGCFPIVPMPEVPMYREGIQRSHQHAAYTVIHHPSKEGYFIDEVLPLIIDGVEIWNSRYEGSIAPSMRTVGFGRRWYPHALPFGGLDIHNRNQLRGPHLVVDVHACTMEAIMSAIRSREVRVSGSVYSYTVQNYLSVRHVLYRGVLRTLYVCARKLKMLLPTMQ